ncbi:MAG: hypothetical protein ACE5I5_12090 [Candidatus Heimdallarchaeota archaeon]
MSNNRYVSLSLADIKTVSTIDWQFNNKQGDFVFSFSADLGQLLKITLRDSEILYLQFSNGELWLNLCSTDLANIKMEE